MSRQTNPAEEPDSILLEAIDLQERASAGLLFLYSLLMDKACWTEDSPGGLDLRGLAGIVDGIRHQVAGASDLVDNALAMQNKSRLEVRHG